MGPVVMGITIAYSEEIDSVVVTYSGLATPEEIQETIRVALATAVENRCRRFLVDASELQNHGGTLLDTYELPQVFEHFPNIREYKDAIVLPTRHAEAQDLKFFETISRNRGYDVRVFPDRQTAIDWLTE
jgi:hypothetical protein